MGAFGYWLIDESSETSGDGSTDPPFANEEITPTEPSPAPPESSSDGESFDLAEWQSIEVEKAEGTVFSSYVLYYPDTWELEPIDDDPYYTEVHLSRGEIDLWLSQGSRGVPECAFEGDLPTDVMGDNPLDFRGYDYVTIDNPGFEEIRYVESDGNYTFCSQIFGEDEFFATTPLGFINIYSEGDVGDEVLKEIELILANIEPL